MVLANLGMGRPTAMMRFSGAWLHKPMTFTICAPIGTAAGSVTTIVALMLLDPRSFVKFALLVSIFQYTGDFDLGLSRLSDRLFASTDPANISTVLVGRFAVALCLVLVVLAASLFTGMLTFVAGVGGIGLMISNGPVAFYRARSNIPAFTASAILLLFGLSIPRLAGLLAGGVAGCLLATAAWYCMTAAVLNFPFVRSLRVPSVGDASRLFATSLPLFMFSTLWSLYLMINRWYSWLLTSESDAGRFAFGASLVLLEIGVIGMVSQAYYPRHIASMHKPTFRRELTILLALATIGAILGALFCRYALALVFPHFVGAEQCVAALLVSGIPLCVSAWLIPIVIAKSQRPFLEAAELFGVCGTVLFGLMWLAGTDIVRQAWACTPPAMMLVVIQLWMLVRIRLVDAWMAVGLWLVALTMVLLCVGVWYAIF